MHPGNLLTNNKGPSTCVVYTNKKKRRWWRKIEEDWKAIYGLIIIERARIPYTLLH